MLVFFFDEYVAGVKLIFYYHYGTVYGIMDIDNPTDTVVDSTSIPTKKIATIDNNTKA